MGEESRYDPRTISLNCLNASVSPGLTSAAATVVTFRLLLLGALHGLGLACRLNSEDGAHQSSYEGRDRSYHRAHLGGGVEERDRHHSHSQDQEETETD